MAWHAIRQHNTRQGKARQGKARQGKARQDKATSHHITSHHLTSHHLTSHHITSHRIASQHSTAQHSTSHYNTLHSITYITSDIVCMHAGIASRCVSSVCTHAFIHAMHVQAQPCTFQEARDRQFASATHISNSHTTSQGPPQRGPSPTNDTINK